MNDPDQPEKTRSRWQGGAIFLLCLVLYVMTASGQVRSWDARTMLASAKALATAGTWQLTPEQAEGLCGVVEVEGRGLQAIFAPGYPLTLVPAVRLGIALAAIWDAPVPRRFVVEFPAAFVNAVLTSLTVLLLWHSLMLLALSSRRAAIFSLAYGLGSPALVYAKCAGSAPLTMLCVATAIHGLILWRRSLRWGYCAEAILASGVAGLTRYPFFLLVPIIAVAAFFSAPRAKRSAATAVVLLCAGLVGALLLWNNSARFGSPFTSGYSLLLGGAVAANFAYSPLEVLGGIGMLTVSPGRGLLIYCPLLLWALVAVVSPRKEAKPLIIVLAGTVAIFTVIFGAYRELIVGGPIWVGGWGPRFVIPVVPLVVLLAALGYENLKQWAGKRKALLALVIIGFLANVPAIVLNYRRADREFRFLKAEGRQMSEAWSVRGSPLVLQWQAVAHLIGIGEYPQPRDPIAQGIRAEIESAPTLSLPDLWWVYYLNRDSINMERRIAAATSNALCLVPCHSIARATQFPAVPAAR